MKAKEIPAKLDRLVARICKDFRAPENITVSAWADRYRVLSRENAAESGRWKTARTPYLKEIMDSFTDDAVERIYVVASSQVGKTECENNIIGYIIDQDPGTIVFAHPKTELARNFAKRRIDPMLRDCAVLRGKVTERKKADGGSNTVQLKTFPGGALVLVGTQSAKDLAETPARYVIGDEVDRWPADVDGEGNPWKLLEARTTTFYNRKLVAVSTPTVKGSSQIASLFEQGTQEYWSARCPHCGEYSFVTFDHIHFDKKIKQVAGKEFYKVENIRYCCPECGSVSTERQIKDAPHKWIAQNPDALETTQARSFWINGFSSPWQPWEKAIQDFLDAGKDASKLQAVFNTKFGELWEQRGDIPDEAEVYGRRENYDAELPDGVLYLTMGVDTQDNRLEYEVVGYGFLDETWGIERGYIMGDPGGPDMPDQQSVWTRLDALINKRWAYANGMGLRISAVFVDEGGHHTQDVYEACEARKHRQVYACKGKGGEGIPFTRPATRVQIVRKDEFGHRQHVGYTNHFLLGVDAGKSAIMGALRVKEPGARYCHFPLNEGCGYTMEYFHGLLSETRVRRNNKWYWEKIPGHERNEPLDCRNYANAAYKAASPNLEKIAEVLNAGKMGTKPKRKKKKQQNTGLDIEGW